MNRFLGAALVLAILILSAAVTVIGLRPTPVRTITHIIVQTRTVTPSPRVIIRYRPATQPDPSPTAAPSPAATLPYGVTSAGAGYPAGSYFINCQIAQCVIPGLAGAGPFETTCSRPSTSMQFCQGGTQ
jgi:hypothetical protein